MLDIDNVGVLVNLVNGTTKHRDLGSMAHGAHFAVQSLQISWWLEHVASWSNAVVKKTTTAVFAYIISSCYMLTGEGPVYALSVCIFPSGWVKWFGHERVHFICVNPFITHNAIFHRHNSTSLYDCKHLR